ncbi:MAG: hypothetical protein ACJATA_001049 [Sphingobacteriales bacterium]|jgi:hypothetical protein
MKKLIRFTFVALAACVLYFGVSSCEEGASPLLIDVDLKYENLTLKIDSGVTTSGEVTALDTLVEINVDSLIKAGGGSIDDIKSLIVQSFTIKLINPVGGNFDAIKSFSLSVAPGSDANDIIQIITPGTKLTKGASEVVVPVTDEDMVRLLQENAFIIKATITLEDGVEITEGLVAEATLLSTAKVSPL